MLLAPEATREAGLDRLAAFVPAAGSRYARTRNFDFGPERRANVSLLSPFLRHRLVLEREVLEAVLTLHSPAAAAKFVQEIFWRAYFKGWLEQHPTVWSDYRDRVAEGLRRLDADAGLHSRYEQAIRGATGIDCFDAWAQELVRTGYLHNHARMWFASIWVYTLQLPWQLGADFFLRHLVDGDPASNTLSWRWVCGLHTRGKTYLARVSNIVSYTDGRFNPQGRLAISAPPLTETRGHPLQPLPKPDAAPDGGRIGLLVTEEDCAPELLLPDLSPAGLLGIVSTGRRSPLPVGLHAAGFARAAVADAVRRAEETFGVNGEVVETPDWSGPLVEWATAQKLDAIVTSWTPVGPAADALDRALPELERFGIELRRVRRRYDSVSWTHAKRGYFKLKENIPAILRGLEIGGAGPVAKTGTSAASARG